MAILQCYYCKKINIEHNRDGKSKITCVDCDKNKSNKKSHNKKAMNESDDYRRNEFKKMIHEARIKLLGSCPLIEDEAIIWAGEKIMDLESRIGKISESLSINQPPLT